MPTKLLVRLGRIKPTAPKKVTKKKKGGKKTAVSACSSATAASSPSIKATRGRPRKSTVGTPAQASSRPEAEAEADKREVQEVSARCEREEKEIGDFLEELLEVDGGLEVQGGMIEEGSARCYSDDPESWPTSPVDAPRNYLSSHLDQTEMQLDVLPTSSSTSTTPYAQLAVPVRVQPPTPAEPNNHGSIQIETVTGSQWEPDEKYEQALRCWFPVEHAYGLPGPSYPWALGHP